MKPDKNESVNIFESKFNQSPVKAIDPILDHKDYEEFLAAG